MMADHLEQGALSAASVMGDGGNELRVERKEAKDATIDDLLNADGYLFCAPENLASLSGEMKEFFDRTYYGAFQTREEPSYSEDSILVGRPYGLVIAAGSDGSSAAKQVERICQGWRLKPVADSLVWRNGLRQTKENILMPKTCLPDDAIERCEEIGGRVAAVLMLQE